MAGPDLDFTGLKRESIPHARNAAPQSRWIASSSRFSQ
jgi:hypothetical protein